MFPKISGCPLTGFAGNDSIFFSGEKLATAAMTGPARFVFMVV
jgi:hypothetical protein